MSHTFIFACVSSSTPRSCDRNKNTLQVKHHSLINQHAYTSDCRNAALNQSQRTAWHHRGNRSCSNLVSAYFVCTWRGSHERLLERGRMLCTRCKRRLHVPDFHGWFHTILSNPKRAGAANLQAETSTPNLPACPVLRSTDRYSAYSMYFVDARLWVSVLHSRSCSFVEDRSPHASLYDGGTGAAMLPPS